MDLFSPFITILGYPLSGIELIGTLSGLLAVALAARSNILTWPIGIINVSCFFFIFYNVELYSDMLLQIYYFIVSIYGWWIWNKKGEERLSYQWLPHKQQVYLPIIVAVSTLILGMMIARIHLWFPQVFTKPADYPFTDTFIASGSIVATFLQARKKIDSWVIWILVDIVCTIVYWIKDIRLIAVEFFIFVLIACYGLYQWIRMERSSRQNTVERNSIQ